MSCCRALVILAAQTVIGAQHFAPYLVIFIDRNTIFSLATLDFY